MTTATPSSCPSATPSWPDRRTSSWSGRSCRGGTTICRACLRRQGLPLLQPFCSPMPWSGCTTVAFFLAAAAPCRHTQIVGAGTAPGQRAAAQLEPDPFYSLREALEVCAATNALPHHSPLHISSLLRERDLKQADGVPRVAILSGCFCDSIISTIVP